VGTSVGVNVGAAVGVNVGVNVGAAVGAAVGAKVGTGVGNNVGVNVGGVVGAGVGDLVTSANPVVRLVVGVVPPVPKLPSSLFPVHLINPPLDRAHVKSQLPLTSVNVVTPPP